MQTIINVHAHERDRCLRRRRVAHKAHRVVGVGVGVLAVEVALAAEVVIEASMVPVWFPLLLSLCKPCGGRDDLCVQEFQARGRNKSIASTPQLCHPRPLPQRHKPVAVTLRCEDLLKQSHQEAKGRVQAKQRGSRRRQEERTEVGGAIERMICGLDRRRCLARGEVELLANPPPPSEGEDALARLARSGRHWRDPLAKAVREDGSSSQRVGKHVHAVPRRPVKLWTPDRSRWTDSAEHEHSKRWHRLLSRSPPVRESSCSQNT